jgi:tRNA dimethylallyltransferase
VVSEPLILVIGPTAVGKSDLALDLAESAGGAILSADAMQVYRGFDRGTGKPGPSQRARVPHFLIDIADPRRDFSAGDFVRAAEAALEECRRRSLRPIVVGGTGLYVRALLRGLFDGPPRDPALRERLHAGALRRGLGHLHRLLARLDPVSAERLGPADEQRLVRALEVRLTTGRPLSQFHAEDGGDLWLDKDRYPAVKIGLSRQRGDLVERIRRRVDGFFDAGLVEEVRRLLAAGVPGEANAFKGIGYRESLAAVRGEIAEEEARRRTFTATCQYAKRQMTWFRREARVRWIRADRSPQEICRMAEALLN